MAIIHWYDHPEFERPERLRERLQREMNRVFSDYADKDPHAGVFPPLNVSEDQGNLYVRAELPGIKADQLEISVEGSTLTLSGEKTATELKEGASYHRRERETGRFRRMITLPTRIETGEVQASFKNGVLKITLPKAKELQPKQIKIKKEE